MPHFLRIKNTMIHVPSLFNINMGTSWFGHPFLRISFHTKQEIKIMYSTWESCECDLHRLMIAITEVATALKSISLIEEVTKELTLPISNSPSVELVT